MPSSESEDFESADEGHSDSGKIARKKRLSSSNYSDNASDQEFRRTPTKPSNVVKPAAQMTETDGWDEFDVDDNGQTMPNEPAIDKKSDCKDEYAASKLTNRPEGESEKSQITKCPSKTTATGEGEQFQSKGWDDFDDWGQEEGFDNVQKEQPTKATAATKLDSDIKSVTDRLAATSTGGSGWGWGWSMDTLLSTATAGITTITSQVSQGISTVLETGIGAPDPEELARKSVKDNETKVNTSVHDDSSAKETVNIDKEEIQGNASETQFQFGSLISGVTKFVETTGTKVIAGGLDTLETIGKKTMEVLQDGDPGLAKKRAMLGLDAGDKPVLSQVLKEAKAKADEEDKIREQKREAKEVHYENLFDDFEGLVHLEALEMLSRQVGMRIEERLRGAGPDKRQDIKETLQQVAELCELPEEEDDDEESPGNVSKADAFHERLQTATQDLGLKLQFQPLVKQYSDILAWLSTEAELTEKAIYKRGVGGLAQATALAVELYHKAAEMLLVKARRSTADEADALTQMTVVLTKHTSELATLFTEKMNSLPSENKEQINNFITNIFLEAGNSSSYIQNAFQLALPILQIGAV